MPHRAADQGKSEYTMPDFDQLSKNVAFSTNSAARSRAHV